MQEQHARAEHPEAELHVIEDDGVFGQLVNSQGTFKLFDPLIDPELHEAVQRTLGTDGKRQGRRSKHFLLAGGLLRCGCCGYAMSVRRAETPAGLRAHYRCMGRRSAAAECKQPDVPRGPIDQAVLEYFTLVALDVEGTIEQLTGERDRRLAEVDAKLAQAHSVQAEAEAQLERLDALLREGMTLDEWRRVAAPPQRDAEAAAGAITDPSRPRPRCAGCSTGSPCSARTHPTLRAGSTPSCMSARPGAT